MGDEFHHHHNQHRQYNHQHFHHRHRRSSSITTIIAVAFLICTSICTAIRPPTSTHHQLGERESSSSSRRSGSTAELEGEGMERRRLSGPGSSPPTCRFKCGRCTPCRPVHVAIQPGLTLPLEYYPEAWRCKCSNKLFMP